MRIALVTDWMSNAGGVEAYFHTLRGALRAGGHDVALFACGPHPDPTAEYSVVGSTAALMQAGLQIANPFAWQGLRAMARDFTPDIALLGHFAYHISPAALAALGDVPRVAYLMDYKAICPLGTRLLPDLSPCADPAGMVCYRNGCVSLPHWMRDVPRYALMRHALEHSAAVLSPSGSSHRQLAAHGFDTTVLTLPVPPPGPRYRRHPAAVPRFLYAGRLSREKGVPLLLDAFAHVRRAHPDAELRIAGDGPQRAQLARSVTSSPGITLLGPLSPAQVEEELAGAWALVAPSLWEEPFGLVALEAIIRGVPVVASSAGGFADNVTHGRTGILFPTADIGALVAALTSIASRSAFPELSLAESDVLRAREHSSPARHARALVDIFERVRRRGTVTPS